MFLTFGPYFTEELLPYSPMINDFNRDYNFEQERVNEDFLCCFFLSAFVIQIEKFLFDLITVRERPR